MRDNNNRRGKIIIYESTDEDSGIMLTYLQKSISRCQDDLKALGMIISYILLYFPGQKEAIKSCIESANYAIGVIQYPNDPIFYDKTVQEKTNHFLLGILALYLTIPFKNLTKLNYNAYFASRASAISAIMGLQPNELSLPCPGIIAISLNKIFTGMNSFRGQIIRILLNPRLTAGDQFRDIAYYILDLAEFIEMKSFDFVWKALITSNSPVLFIPELSSEVSNYMTAMKTIVKCEYPQYFRLLGDPQDMSLIERARFPTLVDLSIRILALRFPSMKNFAKQRNVASDYVTSLFEYHMDHITSIEPRVKRDLQSILDVGVDYELIKAAKDKEYVLNESKKRRITLGNE